MTDTRRADLAKIHLARKQLGMDDDTYRDMLWTLGRVRSAADLDDEGRRKVVAHLRSRGAKFTAPKRAGQRPHNYDRLAEYVVKVEALLTDMGLSWAYADSIARRITGGNGAPGKAPGIERLAWVRREEHWKGIIAALHVEQEKRSLLASIDGVLAERGKRRNYIEQWLPQSMRRSWQRDRKLLRLVLNALREGKL